MSIVIDIMDEDDYPAYEAFLMQHPDALFYHSLSYRKFLSRILGACRSFYLLAKEGSKIVGVLPCFLQDIPGGRTVLNSLPFFGSHGGLLLLDDTPAVKQALLEKVQELATTEKSISMTVIDNLMSPQSAFYEDFFALSPTDYRIGQITDLSVPAAADAAAIYEALMNKFHKKTRNMVRKAEKSGFEVEIINDLEAFKTLHEIHAENMGVIGGRVKPFSIFQAIHDVFVPDQDYRIYVAKRDGEIAAMMLVFYYKNFCEYFTPVIRAAYRGDQPLSLLISQAMQDCVKNGRRFWNWGGTWISQDGVYLFKKRWGADDKPYNYFTRVLDQPYIDAHGQQVIDSSYFYVYPKPR